MLKREGQIKNTTKSVHNVEMIKNGSY